MFNAVSLLCSGCNSQRCWSYGCQDKKDEAKGLAIAATNGADIYAIRALTEAINRLASALERKSDV